MRRPSGCPPVTAGAHGDRRNRSRCLEGARIARATLSQSSPGTANSVLRPSLMRKMNPNLAPLRKGIDTFGAVVTRVAVGRVPFWFRVEFMTKSWKRPRTGRLPGAPRRSQSRNPSGITLSVGLTPASKSLFFPGLALFIAGNIGLRDSGYSGDHL